MKNVDDQRAPMRPPNRGQLLRVLLQHLRTGQTSRAIYTALQYDDFLSDQDLIEFCRVLYGLAGDEACLDPQPRAAQGLASHWLLVRAAHAQGVYLYPSEIEELINQGKLDEARVKADQLPSNGYKRHILADIARRASATKTES